MKNSYHFNKLIKHPLASNEDREAICSLMLQSTTLNNYDQVLTSLKSLEPHLTSDYYYVAHKLLSYKGKRTIFKGELYKAERNNLLSFLEDTTTSGDLRELLISPVEAQPNRKTIYISEDAIYLYTAAQ